MLLAQLWSTLWDPMDLAHQAPSVHEIFQAILLEQVATSYFRGSSRPRDQAAFLESPAGAGRLFTPVPHRKPYPVKIMTYRWARNCEAEKQSVETDSEIVEMNEIADMGFKTAL